MNHGIQGVPFAWLVTIVLRESPQMVGVARMAMLLPALIFMAEGQSRTGWNRGSLARSRRDEETRDYGIISRIRDRGRRTMTEGQKISRRKFIATTSKTAATIPVVAVLGERTFGEETGASVGMAKLEESNPVAVALGYKHDANEVDIDRFAKRASEEGKTQFCDNCLHYKPSAEEGWGPCAIFPGFVVAAKGWCNVWVKVAA